MTVILPHGDNLFRHKVRAAAHTINALTTAAGALSMAGAVAFSELVGLRTIYVVCGLIITGAGLLGLFVLQDPKPDP